MTGMPLKRGDSVIATDIDNTNPKSKFGFSKSLRLNPCNEAVLKSGSQGTETDKCFFDT